MIAFLIIFISNSSAFGLNVNLMIKVIKLPDNRVQINGKTNLPVGTQLMLSVEENAENGFWGQSNCVVSNNGDFNSEVFGPNDGLKDGRYIAEVLMPVPAVQPPSVLEIIGRNGEKLTGNLVSKDEFGIVVSQKEEFTIGLSPDAAQKERRKKENYEIDRLKKQLCVYLDQLLSFKDDPKFKKHGFAKGGPFNKWLINVEKLRDDQPIGDNQIPIALRVAPGDLLMIGMDFMQKGDTNFTRNKLPELKGKIDFESYLKKKTQN